ncbi:MAG: hypothetical protein RLZZ435_2577, partial [Cyanobacteriota bacterium]
MPRAIVMAPDLPTQSVQILQKTYHLPLLRSEQLQDIQSRLR